jgi:hypothetical protein
LLAEVVCPTEVEDFFLYLGFSAELRVLRAELTVNQSLLAAFLVRPILAVEDLAGNAEMATGRGYVTVLFGRAQAPRGYSFSPSDNDYCRGKT